MPCPVRQLFDSDKVPPGDFRGNLHCKFPYARLRELLEPVEVDGRLLVLCYFLAKRIGSPDPADQTAFSILPDVFLWNRMATYSER